MIRVRVASPSTKTSQAVQVAQGYKLLAYAHPSCGNASLHVYAHTYTSARYIALHGGALHTDIHYIHYLPDSIVHCYINTYIQTYARTTYMHTCTYITYMHIYICMPHSTVHCIRSYIHASIHTCIPAYRPIPIQSASIHTDICVHMHTDKHAYMHACMHRISTYTYIYDIQTCMHEHASIHAYMLRELPLKCLRHEM